MISAYLDESFDTNKQGCFVVGGIMGRGVPVFELERRWKALRERPDIDIPFFKASQCQAGSGEFAKFVADKKNISPAERCRLDVISKEFLKLVVKPIAFDSGKYLCVFGVGLVQEDFYELINEDSDARAVLGSDPYFLAYYFAMVQCAWMIKQLYTGERVAFVCDEHEQYSALAAAAYGDFKAKNPTAAEHMGTFSFSDEKKCEPLQAADAAVFEVRRALNLNLGQWTGEIRSQFRMLADAEVMTLIMQVTRDQLSYVAKNQRPGEPFNLDILMERQIDEDIRF